MKNNYKQNRKFSSKTASKGGDNSQIDVNDQFAHIEPVQAQPLEVKVYNNNFDKALRAFRALVQKERVLSIYKERQTYEKPSDKRRRKNNDVKRKRKEEEDYPEQFSEKKKKTFKSNKPKNDESQEK